MLDFQLVQAPFRFGVEEGTDPKQVPFGTLLTAENVVWKKSGRLEKRYGTDVLPTSIVGGGNVSAAYRLVTRGDELALVDGSYLYSYTSNGWVSRGRIADVGLTWSTSVDTITGVASSDAVVLSNYQIVEAWITGDPALVAEGALYYQIRDLLTGSVVTAATRVADTVPPRCLRLVASGTTWALLWVDPGGNLYATTSTGDHILKSDAQKSADACLDAAVFGTNFVVAYTLDAGGIRKVLYSVATTPVQQSTGTVTGEASTGIQSITVAGGPSEKLYVVYFDNSAPSIKFEIANPSTMAQTVAVTALDSTAGMTYGTVAAARESATSCLVVCSYAATAVEAGKTKTYSISSTGTATPGQETYYMRPMTRPFLVSGGSRFYCALATDFLAYSLIATLTVPGQVATTSSDTFLADVTRDSVADVHTFRQVGKIDALVGGCWVRGYVSSSTNISTGSTLFPVGYQSSPATGLSGMRQGVRLVSATTGAAVPDGMWSSVEMSGEAYITAGMFVAYDGADAIGYGWPHGPYLDVANIATSAAGGSMATGNYVYNVTAERRSFVGVLHRSPVGTEYTYAVTGPTGTVTLAVVPSSLGNSHTNRGEYVFFRSTVGGSIPQRLSVEPSYATISDDGTSFYGTTVDDTYADSAIGAGNITLASRPAIYTQGGELEDTQPPALLAVTVYRGRIFGIAGDQQSIWFTKNYNENPGIAPGFNAALRIVVNDTLTALAVLDDRLIIFSETGIYYMAGDGPAPNGDSSDYPAPNRIQTAIGCTNPRSVASTAEGVFFASGSDLYLLTRGLEVQHVGKKVQDLLASYPDITSAVVVADKNHVRFSCNASDGVTGIVLVYDTTEGQWSVFKYGASLPIADARMWAGAYTFVTPSGVVYFEDSSTYLDNGSWVTMKLETAWVHAAGPLAYHSVRNFRIDGVSVSPHGLSISVGFDGNTTYQQGPATWAEGVSDVTSIGDSVTANVSIGTRRKCRSIRFKVEDSAPAMLGTGQGVKWSSMGIEVGQKRGFGVLAERQKG